MRLILAYWRSKSTRDFKPLTLKVVAVAQEFLTIVLLQENSSYSMSLTRGSYTGILEFILRFCFYFIVER